MHAPSRLFACWQLEQFREAPASAATSDAELISGVAGFSLLTISTMDALWYVGVDVSKDSFDSAYAHAKGYRQHTWSNTARGHADFYAHLLSLQHPCQCVLEASGPYYLPLASFLHEQGVAVSVVNPLVVKRYSQMLLLRAKTDRQDAVCLTRYGRDQHPGVWTPDPLYITQLAQLQTLREQYVKQHTALSNQRHAFQATGIVNPLLVASLERMLGELQQEIQALDDQIHDLGQTHYQQELAALRSIPGIGPKTALMLLTVTHGFRRFDTAKQLASYAGLCPRIIQSGSSVRGQNRLCKLGMARLRQLLYLAAMQAKKCNGPCQALYERLLQAGKPKMKALLAVAHKLLRQAFAIGKYQRTFDQNFIPKPCI